MNIVVGVDPGTGVSSPTGFAVFNPHTKEIIYAEAIGTKKKLQAHRIRDIATRFSDLLHSIDPDAQTTVAIERFVMAGRPGEVLARLSGALLGSVPYDYEVVEVFNTTVKKVVGGSGKADKVQVAKGVYKWFGSQPILEDAIEKEQWDIVDALAIGLTGWLQLEKETNSKRS